MLITSIPQYIQGITNAKVDLTTTDLTTLFTVPSDAYKRFNIAKWRDIKSAGRNCKQITCCSQYPRVIKDKSNNECNIKNLKGI
jgi:hypothetical protein